MSKIYDLVAVTGEYTDRDGNPKKRYETVGAVMQGQNGGQYIALSRIFNPAGLPDPQGRGSVILSCFEPRMQGQQGGGYAQRPQTRQDNGHAQPQANGYGAGGRPSAPLDDDIPFAPEFRL